MNQPKSEAGAVVAGRIDKYVVDNGPMVVDQRTIRSPLKQVGGGIIEFPDGGQTAPWKLPYEEILYLICGDWTVTSEGCEDVSGSAGDVILLPQGATVTYSGSIGARAFYALTPADWFKSHTG